MEFVNLKPIGDLTCTRPSLVLCYDIIADWGDDPSRAKVGRLCAAAIGLCTQAHQTQLPVYKISSLDVVGYGNICLDRLLKRGVTAGAIVNAGMSLIQDMADALPKESEVDAQVNFSNPEQPENITG